MSIHNHEEPLEPIARILRFKAGLKHIPKDSSKVLLDLGCGPKIRFYNFSFGKGIKFKKYIGIDPLLSKETIKKYSSEKLELIKSPLEKSIPLKDGCVDIVVGFAFLEHVQNPEKMLEESLRVIKKGGRAIFTTPSVKSQKLLEFLSFKLGLISKREIEEHKNYFNKNLLLEMVKYKKKHRIIHSYFEFGWNNILIIEKI